MGSRIDTAFVLAAGLGKRMRPLTETRPKPLVPLAGRALIDHVLDRLEAAGIGRVVVNVHYLADQMEVWAARRAGPSILISDERERLLDTGGGMVKALPLLGPGSIIIHNSDSVWIERGASNISRLMDDWDPLRMDALLLLAPVATCLGYAGRGDFHLSGEEALRRPVSGERAAHVFAGVSLASPRLLRAPPEGAFSLNRLWDRAEGEGRLYGRVLEGTWMHVGDPQALGEAEACIEAAGALLADGRLR